MLLNSWTFWWWVTPATLQDVIDYFTICASAGKAIDFGDLDLTKSELSSASSSTRGLFAGVKILEEHRIHVIDYVEIATTGDALDFGDLIGIRKSVSRSASSTGALFIWRI